MTTYETLGTNIGTESNHYIAGAFGQELYNEISLNGLMLKITSDSLGISRIENIENRLGRHLKDVDVLIESDPDNIDGFLARFVIREIE